MAGKGGKGLLAGKTTAAAAVAANKDKDKKRPISRSARAGLQERIGRFFDEDRKDKVGTPIEEGITLSEHIDVQITWRDETERPMSCLVSETFDLISFLNLTRAENFDTGSRSLPSLTDLHLNSCP